VETLIAPALGRKLGYAAHDLRKGLPVFGLLMAGWTLMAVIVSPFAYRHREAPRQVAAAPQNPVVACNACAVHRLPRHHRWHAEVRQ
jgi:hypothetical protein